VAESTVGAFASPFDGIEIVYEQWNTDAPGVPVVLLHGFAADTFTNWVATGVVDALVASGRRVASLDARGHGRSAKPHDVAAYQDPSMVDDLSGLIDHLQFDLVDLVGYSMGGVVALETATREARLRTLVVGGIGAGALPDHGTVGPPIDRDAIADVLETDDPSGADPVAAGFRALADFTGADRLALAALLRANAHTSGDLTTIGFPAIVIAGDADPLAAGVDELVAAIPGARFVSVPGDHLAAVIAPGFIGGIIAFLDEVGATA
jgi:pimeloyl-ACP methyl ester carboxylesterase